MTAKVCPRCGTQYEDLKSTTCPQCFAKLLVVDEATAEELRAARESVERTPEFQVTKAADDERFREQSFGACLGVIVIALVTTVAIAVAIGLAMHRDHRTPRPLRTSSRSVTMATPKSLDILTPLPVAAAAPDNLLPPTVGPFVRKEVDSAVTLPGTLTHVYHAAYLTAAQDKALTPPMSRISDAQTMDVYVLSTGRPTSEQSAFLSGIALAAQRGPNQGGLPRLVFATEHWRYAVIGPRNGIAEPDGFYDALATHFQDLSHGK